jgi:hypothetical protein
MKYQNPSFQRMHETMVANHKAILGRDLETDFAEYQKNKKKDSPWI